MPEAFPKSFPKSFPKLIPSFFPEESAENLKRIIQYLESPKSASELATLMSISTRTLKDKYLSKMMDAGVIALTIPDKPTSSNQRYKLVVDE